jgi:hypothetical protein
MGVEIKMKSKDQVAPQTTTPEKPAKVHLTDAQFRRRLKNISDWRKKRLAKLTRSRMI